MMESLDIFNFCSAEDLQILGDALDKNIKTFLPLRSQEGKLEELAKLIVIRRNLKLCSNNETYYRHLCNEAEHLLVKAENTHNDSQNLLIILENSLHLMQKDTSIEILVHLIDISKNNLSTLISHQWFEGPDIDINKFKINFEILDLCVTLILKFQIKDMPLLVDSSMNELIVNLSTCSVENISSQILLRLWPKLIECQFQPQLLRKLWDIISNKVQEENGRIIVERNYVFMLLCTLIGYFLPSDKMQVFLVQDNKFWNIIQSGIIHRDQIIRKQSRYLLKRTLDYIDQNNIDIEWKINTSTWNQFFLIIESLEEKQVHLIKPMFPLIEKLFLEMDFTWYLCALTLVINHDNNFVIKWGLNYFFSNFSRCSGTESFVLNTILPALNNTTVYNTEELNASDICQGLGSVFQNMAACEDTAFFQNLLKSLVGISWAPVPLFHVSQALGSVPKLHAWGPDDLIIFKKVLIEVLISHNVYLRAASQSYLLRGLLSLLDLREVELHVLAEILAMFNMNESLSIGSKDWLLVSEWLTKNFSLDSARHFTVTYLHQENTEIMLNNKAVSRMILLLCETQEDLRKELHIFLCNETSQFDNSATRLYIDHNKAENTLDLLNSLFLNNEALTTSQLLTSIIVPKSASILSYLHNRLLECTSLLDYSAVLIYVDTLEMLASCPQSCEFVLRQDIDCALNILTSKDGGCVMQKFYAAKIIELFINAVLKYKQVAPSIEIPGIAKVRAYITTTVQAASLNTTATRSAACEMTRDLHALRGRLTSDYLKSIWSTLYKLEHLEHLFMPPELLIQLAVEGIEVGGPQILPPIMSVLQYYLHKVVDTQNVKNVINKCFALSFEFRKTDLFWLSIKQFIVMIYRKDLLAREDFQELLEQLTEELHKHSQVVVGLFNLVVSQVTSTLLDISSRSLVHILRLGLLFGPVLRKDQRIEHNTCLFVKSLGEEIPANQNITSLCSASQEVRCQCINFVLTHKDPQLIEDVVHQLIACDMERISRKNLRYFADSQVHRVKHRTAQTVLLLQPFLSKEISEEVLNWCCHSLTQESHQPSVRYLLEWVSVRVLLAQVSLQDTFLKHMTKSAETRQGSVTSYIAMLYLLVNGKMEQLGKNVTSGELATLVQLASQHILPWSMAQQYNLRLYAQVALMRIWVLGSNMESSDVQEVVKSYSPLMSGLKTSLDIGSGVKNALRLQDDFYFSGFKPISHFTLQTIYHELPRLSNVTSDEWILPAMFDQTNHLPVRLVNPDCLLEEFVVSNWIIKCTSGGHSTDSQAPFSSNIVQRKVTPWKDMYPENTQRDKRKESSLGGLVVVASLVDKAPNLGGLSRTCEVLAASQLVLGNLKITEDQLFQSLSVSAEKWVNMKEVKPDNLPEYLMEMKRQGYTLIAAEQTSQSVPLDKMKFPLKSLLLLGNEKEGIPAELLPLLDVCVEVPQQGVVRSLNVHVTGALFIWQYFQQHRL